MTVWSDLIKSVVDLETYAPDILGDGYKRVQILGILDYTDASRYINAKQLHPTVIANLPAGTTDDYTQLSYLKIMLNNGEISALAIPWVVDTSVVQVAAYRRVRVIINNLSIEREAALRRLLVQNNFELLSVVDDN